ncbi:MAG TPA: TlpA family protein disulfide reductase [Thioalkalivibrio sp.]|nr:TlpA family protein disulfide reductase [Thioalkalivibrio sp.]
MKTKDILIGLFALLLIGGGIGLFLTSEPGLAPAPKVTLQTLEGDTVVLEDLQGQPVLLTFWATTCPGCVKEMPHLVELYERYHAQGLEVIGVAMAYDPPNQVLAMRNQRQLPYTIALDLDSSAARAFGDVRLTPTTFLIDTRGRIIYKKLGEFDMDRIENSIRDMLGEKAA